jgi:hypothetical protein
VTRDGRARQDDRAAFDRVLAKIPAVPPDPWDRWDEQKDKEPEEAGSINGMKLRRP